MPRRNDTERAAVEHALDVFRRIGGHTHHRREAGGKGGKAELAGGVERQRRMLEVDIEHVEAGGLGEPRDLHAARQPHRHRGDQLVAREFLLDHVAHDFACFHEALLFRIGQLDRQHDVTQTLAMDVLRQRNGDAAAERVFDDEIERLQIA
jgi:hypothetical protein